MNNPTQSGWIGVNCSDQVGLFSDCTLMVQGIQVFYLVRHLSPAGNKQFKIGKVGFIFRDLMELTVEALTDVRMA